ncbi:MAG: ferritin family protein [Candidatus Zixiibacteriota bacterium]|nr:MAG: ferritin family protein [candidate division Zixibacteria bacterium]
MYEEQLKDMTTLLKYAIKGEETGYQFYDLLSEKAANPEAKKRLEHLRDDEKRHKATLLYTFRKHIGGEIGELPEYGLDALATVFEKGRLKDLKSEVEYINLAIDAELVATRFYKESMDAVDDKEFKDILFQLAEEENSHYEILMAEREALAGNYFWFATDGTAPMED